MMLEEFLNRRFNPIYFAADSGVAPASGGGYGIDDNIDPGEPVEPGDPGDKDKTIANVRVFMSDGGKVKIEGKDDKEYYENMLKHFTEKAGIKSDSQKAGGTGEAKHQFPIDDKIITGNTDDELEQNVIKYLQEKDSGQAGGDGEPAVDMKSIYEKLQGKDQIGDDGSVFSQFYGHAKEGHRNLNDDTDAFAGNLKPDFKNKVDLADFEENFGSENSKMASTIVQRWNDANEKMEEKKLQTLMTAFKREMSMEFLAEDASSQERELQKLCAADKRNFEKEFAKVLSWLDKNDPHGVFWDKEIMNRLTKKPGRFVYRGGALQDAYTALNKKISDENTAGKKIEDALSKFRYGTPGGGGGGGQTKTTDEHAAEIERILALPDPDAEKKAEKYAKQHGIPYGRS